MNRTQRKYLCDKITEKVRQKIKDLLLATDGWVLDIQKPNFSTIPICLKYGVMGSVFS